MRTVFQKLVSAFLALALMISIMPAVSTPAEALTDSQQNIADWADYYYDATWLCQKTVSGWRDKYTFNEGETYHLPYGQPVSSGAYIGYGVTLDDFLAAAGDADSVFYSTQSAYNTLTSVYYATDCSAFVSLCWGISRNTTQTIPSRSTYIGMATEENIISALQIGDAINSASEGHVILVTDLIFDTQGELSQIEITEQTPPQLKRSYYTPSELADRYSSAYGIYRYEGTVPPVPERGYTSDCTAYAAYGQVRLISETDVMTLPCTTAVSAEAEILRAAKTGEIHAVTGLYKNTVGELWYRIRLETGGDGYIAAKNTEYLGEFVDDITLSGSNAPNGIVEGKSFTIRGTVSASYNRLTTVSVYLYEGFGTTGSPVTGTGDVVPGNAYTLAGSTVDRGTSFGALTTGGHTMVISADYKKYYTQDGTTICTNTGTMLLSEVYFMVIPSSVDQSTCDHTYQNYAVEGTGCTEGMTLVTACTTCGLLNLTVEEAVNHTYGSWVTIDATCTEAGTRSRSCSVCGNVEVETIAATGHDYVSQTLDATCLDYPRICYTCVKCGDSYTLYATDWQETKPEGVDESQLETKIQYRYSDYKTMTSYEPTPEDCTQLSREWELTASGNLCYVSEWPAGFDTTHSLYATYHHTPITPTETLTARTTVDSDELVGYLYYHWCRGTYSAGPINRATSQTRTDTFSSFDAFYSTADPSAMTTAPDGTVSYANGDCCKDTYWYYYIPVYAQTYSEYRALYTYTGWTQWSPWSDTVYTATETRKVETRTLYRYHDAGLGAHSWVDGVCEVCGTVCEHSYENGVCTICSQLRALPAISLKYPTISFEDEILMNVYFSVEDLGDIPVENMGLAIFSAGTSDNTIENAETVVPGAFLNASNGYYCVQTEGIAAKNLGDTIYFSVYIRLDDGTYVYSKRVSYNPVTYANSVLSGSAYSDDVKRLVVAMLNYGAAAQSFFDYHADTLINSQLTAQQRSMIDDYRSDMVAAVVKADSGKTGEFAGNGGFTKYYPSISFEGAFSINYYFLPSKNVEGTMTLYYWNQSAYESAQTLTRDNATASLVMAGEGEYLATVSGIAAKELDRTVYVAAVYRSTDGTVYSSGVLAYSIGAYCVSQASGTGAIQPLAAATGVYGYYAKQLFG